MKLLALLLMLALAGCSEQHQDGEIVPAHYRLKHPTFKYHFNDKVKIHTDFYGDCIGIIERAPYWSEACAVDGVPQEDYVYFFSRMKCRGGMVNHSGGILTRCERGLKKVK
jgi:hypothetical protein